MTKLQYLLFSAILITGLLSIYHLDMLQHELDRELINQIKEMQDMLEKAKQENSELQEQQEERARLHYIRAEQQTEQQQILSRGGRPSIPVVSPSGFTADRFERAFERLGKPGMAGLGQALVDTEAETGVNALVLAGICALESGWGESKLARERNNLAGLGAYDGQEDRFGLSFASREVCVTTLAYLIADGGTLDDVGRWYASDPGWAQKVAGCMRMIGEVGW